MVPAGRVVTYGQVARAVGVPTAARQVGFVLHGLAPEAEVPWQRVINASGGISTFKIGLGELQSALLEHEGIVFTGDRVDLRRYRWQPPTDLAS